MDEHLQNQSPDALEMQENRQLVVVSVESRRKHRRNCLIALLIVLALMTLATTIAVPLVLMNKDADTEAISNTDYPLVTSRAPTTVYTGWSSWTFCSATCGNGTQRRTCQACNVTMETKPCRMTACIEPAYWKQWGQWSSCSTTCSVGTQLRSRNCSSTEIKCDGNGREARNCTPSPDCTYKYCLDLLLSGHTANGVYSIDPDNRGLFSVYCDMKTKGGGWTVFQRRQDGSEDFNLNWEKYKTGFGNLTGEFWLGNDNIHRLTSSLNTSLFINLETWEGSLYNASYGIFDVANENSSYTLTVLQFLGSADVGRSLDNHNGMNFTTKDRDNDQEKYSNCAIGYTGGWWFNKCVTVNLNGKYGKHVGVIQQDKKGIIWMHLSRPNWKAMKTTEMKLRPRQP